MKRVSDSLLPLVRLGGSVIFGVVLVAVTFVRVVDVLVGVVLVRITLVDVMHMAGLVSMVLVAVALVEVVNMLASVMFVFVALVRVVTRSYHRYTPTMLCLRIPCKSNL